MARALRVRAVKVLLAGTAGVLASALGFFAWQSFTPSRPPMAGVFRYFTARWTRPRRCCPRPTAVCW